MSVKAASGSGPEALQLRLEALRRRAEAVRERLSLSDLIGADVRLVKRAREHVGLCPFHADAKVGSFSVNDEKGIFKCFSCGAAGDHFRYLELRKSLSFVAALKLLEADAGIDFRDVQADPQWERRRQARQAEAARDAERRRRNAEGLWLSGAKLAGTPAEAYLRGRAIDFAALGRFPGALRCRAGCSYPETPRQFVAMLTKMTFLDGRHAATHRTFLGYGPTGWVKAAVDRPKMILGDFAGAHIAVSKGDAGVPLKDVPDGTAVAIAEGVEDGLSVAMADPTLFVVAAGALDNIGGLALPPQVSDVVLICQHDRPGSAADLGVERQIGRLQDRGLDVRCMWPLPGFKDFNDQLRGLRMERVA